MPYGAGSARGPALPLGVGVPGRAGSWSVRVRSVLMSFWSGIGVGGCFC